MWTFAIDAPFLFALAYSNIEGIYQGYLLAANKVRSLTFWTMEVSVKG